MSRSSTDPTTRPSAPSDQGDGRHREGEAGHLRLQTIESCLRVPAGARPLPGAQFRRQPQTLLQAEHTCCLRRRQACRTTAPPPPRGGRRCSPIARSARRQGHRRAAGRAQDRSGAGLLRADRKSHRAAICPGFPPTLRRSVPAPHAPPAHSGRGPLPPTSIGGPGRCTRRPPWSSRRVLHRRAPRSFRPGSAGSWRSWPVSVNTTPGAVREVTPRRARGPGQVGQQRIGGRTVLTVEPGHVTPRPDPGRRPAILPERGSRRAPRGPASDPEKPAMCFRKVSPVPACGPPAGPLGYVRPPAGASGRDP